MFWSPIFRKKYRYLDRNVSFDFGYTSVDQTGWFIGIFTMWKELRTGAYLEKMKFTILRSDETPKKINVT